MVKAQLASFVVPWVQDALGCALELWSGAGQCAPPLEGMRGGGDEKKREAKKG